MPNNVIKLVRQYLQTNPRGRRAKRFIRTQLAAVGLELVPFAEGEEAFVSSLLQRGDFACVLDVGANSGQYGLQLRRHGYRGSIVSFEPLPDAYQELAARATGDENWTALQCALGAAEGIASINVTANSVSSSLLPLEDEHIRCEPTSQVTASLPVSVRRLDSLIKLEEHAGPILLKLDVQGFELNVLDGASGLLDGIDALQCELSLRSLYRDQADYVRLLQVIRDFGFDMIYVVPAFTDSHNSEMLQLNATFRRRNTPSEVATKSVVSRHDINA